MIDREQAIKVVLAADVRGSGPLELVQREAEYLVAAIMACDRPLTVTDEMVDRAWNVFVWEEGHRYPKPEKLRKALEAALR